MLRRGDNKKHERSAVGGASVQSDAGAATYIQTRDPEMQTSATQAPLGRHRNATQLTDDKYTQCDHISSCALWNSCGVCGVESTVGIPHIASMYDRVDRNTEVGRSSSSVPLVSISPDNVFPRSYWPSGTTSSNLRFINYFLVVGILQAST